jgi:uncharacterized protein YdeI (BOF family)
MKKIQILLLLLSILSLLFLFIFYFLVKESQKTNIEDLKNKLPGEKVFFSGKIENIYEKDRSILIKIQNLSLPLIILKDPYENLNFEKNSTIQVYGKIQSYQNQTQILVEKITLMKI